ncbi:MAG: DUF6328 family protein [Actinomycetales bacterium]
MSLPPEEASNPAPARTGGTGAGLVQRYSREGELESERLDRNFNEILQELRVAQTGVQILFAFLLPVAFTPAFRQADERSHRIYAATLVLAGIAVAVLIAPVALHRALFRRGLKDVVVRVSARLAVAGLGLLCVTIAGVVLLVLDAVFSWNVAVAVTAVVFLAFVTLWVVLPMMVRRHVARLQREEERRLKPR